MRYPVQLLQRQSAAQGVGGWAAAGPERSGAVGLANFLDWFWGHGVLSPGFRRAFNPETHCLFDGLADRPVETLSFSLSDSQQEFVAACLVCPNRPQPAHLVLHLCDAWYKYHSLHIQAVSHRPVGDASERDARKKEHGRSHCTQPRANRSP